MELNIIILKSSKIQDPLSNIMYIRHAHLAATKEDWGYTIVKDRFNYKVGVHMTHQEFWKYMSDLEKERASITRGLPLLEEIETKKG